MQRLINHLGIVLRSLKKRGLKETFLLLVGEYWFDFRFRVDTSPALLTDDPSVIGSNLATAAPHYGTNWFILKGIFRILNPPGPAGNPPGHLVDFGCGAGRALIAALYFGVPKVTGVEFSRLLCARAERNLTRFARRFAGRPGPAWAVVHCDASTYAIPPDATLFFLYNPFGSPVIEMVAQNILAHAVATRLSVKIIYVNPLHGPAFEQLGFVPLPESNAEVRYYRSPALDPPARPGGPAGA